MESISSVSEVAPIITENENSENSNMASISLNQETKDDLATDDILIRIEEVYKESFKALSSNSFDDALASTDDNVSQPLRQSLTSSPESSSSCPFPSGQKQKNNETPSQSHGGIQNQYQWKSYNNQNVNHHHPHQIHGGTNNHGHVNQNFYGSGRFTQPPGFVRNAPPRPRPPPRPMQPFHAQYMFPTHQHFYPFGGPMTFHAPPLMFYPPPPPPPPPRMPFIEPSMSFYQAQEATLKTRIRNQVHYYFSEENLKSDDFMRKRMDDEGFVHIQFIAGFSKLKALTSNIQLIVDALQDSNIVELKGYEIRSRHMWRKFLMPLYSRVPFYPSV